MARVNVEQKALTDGRFRALGLAVGVRMNLAQATGIGLMTMVWNQCQERETYMLTELEIDGVCGIRGVARKIVAASLGELLPTGEIRIRGTENRVEWLSNSREYGKLGAEHGVKGGRPKKTPYGVSEEPPGGLPEKPPPSSFLLPPSSSKRISVKKDFSKDQHSATGKKISQGQYLYLADQIGQWTEKNRERWIGASDDGPFKAAFKTRFSMPWEAWVELRKDFEQTTTDDEEA